MYTCIYMYTYVYVYMCILYTIIVKRMDSVGKGSVVHGDLQLNGNVDTNHTVSI